MKLITSKARPILFNGDMVRAILDGRKTQTRRTINWKKIHKQAGLEYPTACRLAWFDLLENWGVETDYDVMREVDCPYGQVGDLLWVRETTGERDDGKLYYRADQKLGQLFVDKWKPSIFMPRAVNRITLKITGVRIERLNDISNEDALAEGIAPLDIRYAALDGFKPLWESINGKDSWQENPWLWVIEFEVIKQNIDAYLADLTAAEVA